MILYNQVNLAIDIPKMIKNCTNLHFFTCHHWVCLFEYRSHCWGGGGGVGGGLDLLDYFYSEVLGANRNLSGKLSMKLAIEIESTVIAGL